MTKQEISRIIRDSYGFLILNWRDLLPVMFRLVPLLLALTLLGSYFMYGDPFMAGDFDKVLRRTAAEQKVELSAISYILIFIFIMVILQVWFHAPFEIKIMRHIIKGETISPHYFRLLPTSLVFKYLGVALKRYGFFIICLLSTMLLAGLIGAGFVFLNQTLGIIVVIALMVAATIFSFIVLFGTVLVLPAASVDESDKTLKSAYRRVRGNLGSLFIVLLVSVLLSLGARLIIFSLLMFTANWNVIAKLFVYLIATTIGIYAIVPFIAAIAYFYKQRMAAMKESF